VLEELGGVSFDALTHTDANANANAMTQDRGVRLAAYATTRYRYVKALVRLRLSSLLSPIFVRASRPRYP